MIYILSFSGGKDSLEDGTKVKWLDYVQLVGRLLDEEIAILRPPLGFEARVLAHNTFPGRVNRRWCTEELKLLPFKAEVDRVREETGDDVTVVLGIRAEESNERALMPEREFSDFYDCWVWRPIITWTLADVIAEHHRVNVPLNPLYELGFERVGCFPCIKSGKREIRRSSEVAPAAIDRVRQLEKATGTTMFCLEQSVAGGGGAAQADPHPDRRDGRVVEDEARRQASPGDRRAVGMRALGHLRAPGAGGAEPAAARAETVRP